MDANPARLSDFRGDDENLCIDNQRNGTSIVSASLAEINKNCASLTVYMKSVRIYSYAIHRSPSLPLWIHLNPLPTPNLFIVIRSPPTSTPLSMASTYRTAAPLSPPPTTPIDPQVGVGISIGCFIGASHGLTVGIGRLSPLTRDVSLVIPTPSQTPFAYNGTIIGAFCGVSAGAGLFSSIAVHLGFRWRVLSDILVRRELVRNGEKGHEGLMRLAQRLVRWSGKFGRLCAKR